MGLDVQVHDLKCWDAFFKDIVAGFKTFDIRKDDDRGYRVGDYLLLREWYPGDEAYSGRVAMVRVTAIFSNAQIAVVTFSNRQSHHPRREPLEIYYGGCCCSLTILVRLFLLRFLRRFAFIAFAGQQR